MASFSQSQALFQRLQLQPSDGSMRRRNSVTNIGELLEVIKALEDADYWGPPLSSRKEPKDCPVFDPPPAKFGALNETDDWLAPPPSKSRDKSKPKGKGKDNRLVPTHFDFAFKPPSSVPTRGRGDTAMTLLAGGLAAGLTAGAAATGMSYILPIASLLLLTVNIRDEMKQYQDDWAVVVDKLEKITTLLNNLGKWCTMHGLKERDLPPSLRGIFQALWTELDGLRGELEQSKKVRSTMKKIMLRKDTARRVKQCDGKLSNLLQTFQVALAIDARLEQIKVNKKSHRRRARSIRQRE